MALFSFDMGTGNIYGLVGMAMYGYLRNLVFTLMVPVFLYYLVGFLYSNGNPRVKERLLDMTKLFVASSIGFILFPQLLGIALYLRDAMLHAPGRLEASRRSLRWRTVLAPASTWG